MTGSAEVSTWPVFTMPNFMHALLLQVHSAMISAALGGHLDLLLELKKYQPVPGHDDDYDDSTEGQKTEL